MGLQDLRKDKAPGTAPGASGGAGMGALTAFIDQGSEFSGKLSFRDTVRIDGRFEGEISSDNTLIVGETGEIRANITSEVVIVSGVIEGDVVAKRQLVLHKTARVTGNVQTASMAVEEGAFLSGQVTMGGTRPSSTVSPAPHPMAGQPHASGSPHAAGSPDKPPVKS
jgi:cytoskeletal protein CcmA (bactofilin family)